MNKQALMDFAEVLDAYRTVPRILLACYGWLCWDMHVWIKSLPDISTQQASYSTAIIGLCVPLAGWYMQTGRKWQ